MVRKNHQSGPSLERYGRATHHPLNALVFIVPLLAVFHVGSAFARTSLFTSRDMSRLLGLFGASAWYLPPLLIVGVLVLHHLALRRRWRPEPRVWIGMMVESVVWTLPLFAMNYLCHRLLNAGGMLSASRGFSRVLEAIGAGVYEEFIFRFVLMGLLAWIAAEALGRKKDMALLIALTLSSLAFSLYHFSWDGPNATLPFEWGLFTWRAVAGICLGIIYASRGLGIAVGTHTLWSLCARLMEL